MIFNSYLLEHRTSAAPTIFFKRKHCSCVFIIRRTPTQAILTRWLFASAFVCSKWSRLPHERKRNENYLCTNHRFIFMGSQTFNFRDFLETFPFLVYFSFQKMFQPWNRLSKMKWCPWEFIFYFRSFWRLSGRQSSVV